MTKMGGICRRIVQKRSRDGRMSNLVLAERAGLSPSACLRRVQDLERAGIIAGYCAVIDHRKLGAAFVAYVTVGLSRHTKAAQQDFEQVIAGAPEVRECHGVTGSVEYLLRVEVADLAACKLFHSEVLGTQAQVQAITTCVVMDSPKDQRA